jgi:hypothetical protein
MAGFQVVGGGNLILQRGRPAAPVVDVRLVRPTVKPAVRSAEDEIKGALQGKRPVGIVTTKMRREMRELRAQGVSQGVISKKFGVARTTVGRHTNDIPAPEGGWQSGGHKSRASDAMLQRMRRAGFTYAEIGENFGLAEATIWKRLNRPDYSTEQIGKRPPVHFAVKQIVALTGVQAASLRRVPNANCAHDGPQISRARHILFWMLVRRRGYTVYTAGKALGGFHYASVAEAVERADAVLAALNLPHSREMAVLVRALWAADWSSARVARKAA